jgi:hypothetical protein
MGSLSGVLIGESTLHKTRNKLLCGLGFCAMLRSNCSVTPLATLFLLLCCLFVYEYIFDMHITVCIVVVLVTIFPVALVMC